LADCYTLLGREHDARQLFERLLDLRNDLGLLAEEYDAVAGRLVGNFPQAFSHVSLVNSAAKIVGHAKPSADHVFLGLARQALAGVKPAGMSRLHMAPASATALHGLLVAGSSGRRNRPTTTVAGDTPAGRVSARPGRRATAKSSAKVAAGEQAPEATEAATPKRTAKKSTAKKAATPKSTAKKGAVKKAAVKNAAVERSSVKKVAFKKTATRAR
jgi:hypothetical protein